MRIRTTGLFMEHLLYGYSLCSALSLMLFFGFYFLFGRTPDKPVFSNYLRSRRIMGTALLVLSANYAVHLFTGIRFISHNMTILMNLSTYFICYWLFSSALRLLLDKHYLTRKRIGINLSLWIAFTLISAAIMLFIPDGIYRNAGLLAMAMWLFGYGVRLAFNLIKNYRNSVRAIDETQSDDISAYIRWLSIFTFWAVIFGIGCGLLTFLPDRFIFIWILSSIPFYIYLYCSYMNYILFYEKVEKALEMATEQTADSNEEQEHLFPSCYQDIRQKTDRWISENRYAKTGISIKDLADEIGTNRTYMSNYIKTTYNTSFREWISNLRIEYAKRLMSENRDMTVSEISEMAGFSSLSHFTRTFAEKEKCTPAKWKKTNTN